LLNKTKGCQASKHKSCVDGNIYTFTVVHKKWDVLLEKKKRVLRVRVLGYDVILMIYANLGISKSFSFNVLLVILQNIVVLHNPLSFRLTSEGYIALLMAILQQILEDAQLAMRHKIPF